MRQPPSRPPEQPALLLIQRQGVVARALRRFLMGHYRSVRLADTKETAECLLGERIPRTHVVCGEDFGPGCALGHDLLADWRLRYPEIELAVLATGAERIPSPMSGVDGVYMKPAPLSTLLHLLGLDAGTTPASRSSVRKPLTSLLEHTMKAKSPQAHNVNTLKERLGQDSKNDNQSGQLRTAQGFATA